MEEKNDNHEEEISNKEVINSLKKKNWTSYFKEFFMLFLAVFCGFLAENYRESLSVQKIEKEYMLSLIEDLKTDTSNLQTYIAFKKEKSILMDSLASLMLRRREIFMEIRFIISLDRYLTRSLLFIPMVPFSS